MASKYTHLRVHMHTLIHTYTPKLIIKLNIVLIFQETKRIKQKARRDRESKNEKNCQKKKEENYNYNHKRVNNYIKHNQANINQ